MGERGWAAAVPEICIAAVVVAVAGVAGYALSGLPGAAVALAASAVAALGIMRVIAAPDRLGDPEHPYQLRGTDSEAIPASFTGYWRRRAGLGDAVASLAGFDAGLRSTLQQLLAARLAEHHGISLYADPAAAHRLLCPHGRDQDLWYWIDPARPSATATAHSIVRERPGIPPRTLARLIDRLERL